VLTGDDVVYGEGVKGIVVLVDVAILTAVARAAADEVPEAWLHHVPWVSLRSFRALDWRTAMRVPAET